MECHRIIVQQRIPIPQRMLTLAAQVTDSNAAFFDPAHGFAGCIAGIHEVLRRQGLLEGIWCLDPKETPLAGADGRNRPRLRCLPAPERRRLRRRAPRFLDELVPFSLPTPDWSSASGAGLRPAQSRPAQSRSIAACRTGVQNLPASAETRPQPNAAAASPLGRMGRARAPVSTSGLSVGYDK